MKSLLRYAFVLGAGVFAASGCSAEPDVDVIQPQDGDNLSPAARIVSGGTTIAPARVCNTPDVEKPYIQRATRAMEYLAGGPAPSYSKPGPFGGVVKVTCPTTKCSVLRGYFANGTYKFQRAVKKTICGVPDVAVRTVKWGSAPVYALDTPVVECAAELDACYANDPALAAYGDNYVSDFFNPNAYAQYNAERACDNATDVYSCMQAAKKNWEVDPEPAQFTGSAPPVNSSGAAKYTATLASTTAYHWNAGPNGPATNSAGKPCWNPNWGAIPTNKIVDGEIVFSSGQYKCE